MTWGGLQRYRQGGGDVPRRSGGVRHHGTGAGPPQSPLYPQPHLGGSPLGCQAGTLPLVSYIEDAGAADTSIDLKTHWLGQSQDERTYEGALLRVENVDLKFVTKDSIFPSRRQYVRACNNISFEIFEGETFGLVGSRAPASPPSPVPSPGSIRPTPARLSSRGSISPP